MGTSIRFLFNILCQGQTVGLVMFGRIFHWRTQAKVIFGLGIQAKVD